MSGKGAPLGNQNAKRGMWVRDALRKALAHDKGVLERIARKLIEMAKEGNLEAIKELANRLDGRVPKMVGDPDGDPVQHAVTVIIQGFGDSNPPRLSETRGSSNKGRCIG